MTTEMIALEELKGGSTDYLPGDRLDMDVLQTQLGWSERLIDQLTRSKRIGVLSRETMQMCKARRRHGAPWPPRGFTEPFLVEGGYIDAADAPKKPERAKAAPGKPPGREVVRVDRIKLGDDKIAVGKFFLQPKKSGNFHFFDAADADGKLLRAKSFRKVDDGVAFLTNLSTEAAAPDTPEGKQEDGHGGDVQRGAGGSQG